MITLVSITTIVSGLIFLTCGIYIFFTWKKKKEDFLLKTFLIFLLSIGLQMVFLTLGLAVFFDNPLMSNVCWWIAHIFMLLGTGNLLLLPIKIKFPTKEKLARKIIASYLIIGGLIILWNLPRVELFTIPENIINWRVPDLSIAIIAGFASMVGLFSAYVFISESLRIKERLMKLRSIFLGLGVLIFFIGGPMHNLITTSQMAILAASLSFLGGFFLMSGIYLPRVFKKQVDW